ncbi:MAG TPA: hypothetical protein VMT17_03060 [Anaeromyxobacteraceae bacterium]|nr:hypothetical protein [Anaeromyxobacteraceae bacterium]
MTLRVLFVAFVVASTGCGGTEVDEENAAAVPGGEAVLGQGGHTISGTVVGASGACAVYMGLRTGYPNIRVLHAATPSRTTGAYSFTNIADGTYAVYASHACAPAGLVCPRRDPPVTPGVWPVCRRVTVSGADVSGVNFTVGCGMGLINMCYGP